MRGNSVEGRSGSDCKYRDVEEMIRKEEVKSGEVEECRESRGLDFMGGEV